MALKMGQLLFILCMALLGASMPANGQRAGSSASGGSVRPESGGKFEAEKRVQAQPSPTPFVALTSSSKKEECNPDTVEGTCPGTFAFTYGFNDGIRPRAGGSEPIKGGFAFWVYLSKRIFVELDSDNFISNKDEAGKRVTGSGDTTVYLAADVLLEKKSSPAVSLYYGLKIPTASVAKGLGTGKYDHTALGILSKTFGQNKKTYLEFDIGNVFAGKQSSGISNFPFASFIEEQKINDDLKLHFEVGGTFKASGYEGDAYNLDYAQVRVTKHLLLRLGGKFGITSNVSRAGVYLALRIEGNLWKSYSH